MCHDLQCAASDDHYLLGVGIDFRHRTGQSWREMAADYNEMGNHSTMYHRCLMAARLAENYSPAIQVLNIGD